MTPFLSAAKHALSDDGFLVINTKANRNPGARDRWSTRSLVIERLAIHMEKIGWYCVDIEIWVKSNPVSTGLRAAAQDAYEQILWFSSGPKWSIDIDAIRRSYSPQTLRTYATHEYRPRANGLGYVTKAKRISPNPKGALPVNVVGNVVTGSVRAGQGQHQARQPIYLPNRYILACTQPGEVVVDPWTGSGTTGMAALSANRRFVGFDVDETSVAIATNVCKACSANSTKVD